MGAPLHKATYVCTYLFPTQIKVRAYTSSTCARVLRAHGFHGNELLDNGEFKVETFRVQHISVLPKLDRFERRGSTCFS